MNALDGPFHPIVTEYRAIRGRLRAVELLLAGDGGELEVGQASQLLLNLWDTSLSGLFDDEESVFCAEDRRLNGTDSPDSSRVEAEHQALALLLQRLRVAQPPTRREILERALETLVEHLTWEEESFLPGLARELDASSRARLTGQLVNRRIRFQRGDPREKDLVVS